MVSAVEAAPQLSEGPIRHPTTGFSGLDRVLGMHNIPDKSTTKYFDFVLWSAHFFFHIVPKPAAVGWGFRASG